MRSLFIALLHRLTRRVLVRYHPTIIGITGSVGKTTTKEAVCVILGQSGQRLGGAAGSFNTEIGVPLTVLGVHHSPGRSPLGWIRVFSHAIALLIRRSKEYPEVLVLELGADQPGDIDRLLALVSPITIGVLTAVAPTHLDGFGSIEAVAKEKQKLLKGLKKNATAIFSEEEPQLQGVRRQLKTAVITVGATEKSDLEVFEVHSSFKGIAHNVPGTFFKLRYKGSVVPCFIPGVFGMPSARAVAFGAAAAMVLNRNLLSISEALKHFTPPPGRLRVIPGVKHTTLIDDTYNSSPRAAHTALETLFHIEDNEMEAIARRIVVFGDMAELGSESDALHRALGAHVAELRPDLFLAVGPRMVEAYRSAIDDGYPEAQAFHFDDVAPAARFLQDRLHPSDIVLIKGSQIMRMERAVKELMAEPLRAAELLVRQGPEWR